VFAGMILQQLFRACEKGCGHSDGGHCIAHATAAGGRVVPGVGGEVVPGLVHARGCDWVYCGFSWACYGPVNSLTHARTHTHTRTHVHMHTSRSRPGADAGPWVGGCHAQGWVHHRSDEPHAWPALWFDLSSFQTPCSAQAQNRQARQAGDDKQLKQAARWVVVGWVGSVGGGGWVQGGGRALELDQSYKQYNGATPTCMLSQQAVC
jgi:hypothetical protein